MTGKTFTELLKTYFKFKKTHEEKLEENQEEKLEDPPVISSEQDPVYDAITNCNLKSMGTFASIAFSNAIEQQKELSRLTDELLRSVLDTSLEENKTREELVQLATVEKKEEKEEKDLWEQLIDIAEDPSKEDIKHD